MEKLKIIKKEEKPFYRGIGGRGVLVVGARRRSTYLEGQ